MGNNLILTHQSKEMNEVAAMGRNWKMGKYFADKTSRFE